MSTGRLMKNVTRTYWNHKRQARFMCLTLKLLGHCRSAYPH